MKKSADVGSNVKVVCRFRPLIDIELDLVSDGKEVFKFPTEETVTTLDGESFTFDRVFSNTSVQEEIFEFVGKPIISDVLTGYNGTVLAYGQTGSGKSFSMMGYDIYDLKMQGIIPRAINLIFESVNNAETEAEFTLKCSMLEIYKEKLKDLCGYTGDLKIKENKQRGIFVDGLTEMYVASEEEMLGILAMGERNRTVASTKMNNTSSRSHQLFMLEVKQKLPNDSEKRGTLNLVDLAGSEKINQTGVTGNKLEEAKKINLSLSALGNVIKALTSSNDHIPYRDSKLTRLLQESLGGNYKTTLLVCCSPHPRNSEDTINTLKFAQRAKTIKNKVHVNIKKSAEAYMKIIEELKVQLKKANDETEFWKEKAGQRDGNDRRRSCTLKMETRLMKISEVAMEDNEESEYPANYSEISEAYSEGLKEEVSVLKSENEDLKSKISELTQSLNKESLKRISAEKSAFDSLENYNKLLAGINEKNLKNEYLSEETSSLYNEIECYKNHIRLINSKYNDVVSRLQRGEKVTEWEFNENSESIQPLSVYTHDLINDKIPENLTGITIDPDKLLAEDIYAKEICLALEESSLMNKDIIIFELKKQIINSGLVNCELFRSFSDLKLRETLLSEKFNLKLKLVSFQESKIKTLEVMLNRLQGVYDKLTRHIQQYLSENPMGIKDEGLKRAKIAKPIKSLAMENVDKDFRRRSTNIYGESNNKFRRQSTMLSPNDKNMKFKGLESGYELQVIYNNQLKQEIQLVSNEKEKYKTLYSTVQQQYLSVYVKEKERWKKFLEKFKENCNRELTRKQQEINTLNKQIAHWMSLYLEVQQNCTCQAVVHHRRASQGNFMFLPAEKTMKLNYFNSPLHIKQKQTKLASLNSKRGDISPAIFDDDI